MSIPEPLITFATDNAILLKFTEPSLNAASDELQDRLHVLAQALQDYAPTRRLLEDLVVAPGSLLLVMYDGRQATELLNHAERFWQEATSTGTGAARVIRIPVRYGGDAGPDLEQLARNAGLDPQEVIRRHSGRRYRVHCLGFLPGFAYLGGLDPALHMARKATPALRVKPGSVAIGGSTTGIYPTESPGGWHVIGQTTICLFDPQRHEPALLRAGDQVIFEIDEQIPAVPMMDGTSHD